ncbi:MAG: cytochrome c [Gammaproteobacteria bacterium]|nr:cytochrome c [Gammaproteobacteria bacterium]
MAGISRFRIGGLIAAGFVAVAVLFYQATPLEAREAEKPGDSVRGVTLWADNCARCHAMRDPKEFRDDQWRVIVSHMRVRAGLGGQDARDILAFLQASN